ncbi:hypothetical protein PHMEG_00029060 [Phytophthora megakarya]|uniref:Uncharacterized protein n=1 Tax=Phytophthora megakarya TaxID=4795 RepID=A0A225V3K5_9STRA|nr:hypothetical protein PHMEG_00029060 [Phytophthora megakarya]
MLPSLSDKWGAKLQVLIPLAAEPSNVSTRRNSLAKLKKIESIRVSCSGKDGGTRYAVEVFMNSSVNSCPGLSMEPTGPTVRIVRELWEFKDIAKELHGIVDSAHSSQRCELCSAILNWYVFGEDPDGLFIKFLGSDRVARKLTKFMNDLLATVIDFASDNTQGRCSGQTLVPLAVHKFLFNPSATCDAS